MPGKRLFAAIAFFVLPLAASAQRRAPQFVAAQRCDAPIASVRPLLDTLANDYPVTRGELLLIDGCPAYKTFAKGFSDDSRMLGWSISKTVTAMLVGELVSEGRLKLDAPAPIAEWHGKGDPRAAITLRELLQMRSGLRNIEVGDPVETSDSYQVLFVSGTQHMAESAIAAPLAHKPGTHFDYSSLTAVILSEIVTRTLTDSHDPRVRARAYRRFAQERLFRPAGVTSAFLGFDGAGTQVGGSLIYMTLADWGRIGGLLIDGKAQDGTRIIAPDWLAFMKTPSPANPGYGGQTWLNQRAGAGEEPGLFHSKGPRSAAGMRGHLGQFVVAARATMRDGERHDLVLVRLGHTDEDKLPAVLSRMGDVVQALMPAAAGSPPSR